MKDIQAVVMMTEAEATSLVAKINNSVTQAGIFLREFRDREGWRALGYGSFSQAVAKEFADIYGSRSQVYRLIAQAHVEESVGSPVGIRAAEQLAKLPPEERKEVMEEAVLSHNGDDPAQELEPKLGSKPAPTANQVKEAVERKLESKQAPVPQGKYLEALARISDVCGKEIKKAIADGTLAEVTEKEAVFWASLNDAAMCELQELVVTKRWKPSAAQKFLSRMPGAETRVADLINHAIANGGVWEGTINGYLVKVKGVLK